MILKINMRKSSNKNFDKKIYFLKQLKMLSHLTIISSTPFNIDDYCIRWLFFHLSSQKLFEYYNKIENLFRLVYILISN